MTAENTAESRQRLPSDPQRSLSLAEIDARQDEVLSRLDELDHEILKLTEELRVRLSHETADSQGHDGTKPAVRQAG